MIIKDDRIFEKPPNWNSAIWRYLSMEKFLDIVLNSELFFANLTRLTDQYEGTTFDSDRERIISKIRKGKNYDEEVKEALTELQETDNLKSYTLVNCWTLKKYESFALWKIYVGNGPGVAIKTTVNNLKKSINQTHQEFDEDISIAKVKYRDNSEYPFSRSYATITKKPFYEFEEELRLMIFNFPLALNGYKVPYDMTIGRKIKVDPKLLISEIYISPFIGIDYRNIIQATIIKIAPNLHDKFRISEIYDK